VPIRWQHVSIYIIIIIIKKLKKIVFLKKKKKKKIESRKGLAAGWAATPLGKAALHPQRLLGVARSHP